MEVSVGATLSAFPTGCGEPPRTSSVAINLPHGPVIESLMDREMAFYASFRSSSTGSGTATRPPSSGGDHGRCRNPSPTSCSGRGKRVAQPALFADSAGSVRAALPLSSQPLVSRRGRAKLSEMRARFGGE